MNQIKADFIVHWLYAIVFGILLITGFTLMGAKFGWLMDYSLALADYLHRTLAAAFVILTLVAIVLEAIKFSKKDKTGGRWLIINKSPMGIFTLVVTLLLTLSGIYLLICMEFSHKLLAFAFIIHDLATFLSVIVVIWHIYDKAYGLPRDWEVQKNVQKDLV